MGWIDFTNYWIKPWGTIFVNLLKLIAVPLVFASLIKGVASLSDISKVGLEEKTISIYLISTVHVVSIGLLLVNSVKPGEGFDKESVTKTKQTEEASKKIDDAKLVEEEGPLQFLIDIVPTNIFESVSNNRNISGDIFAILFGISMVMLPEKKISHVKGFFDGINDIILRIVDLIMISASLWSICSFKGLVVDFGHL